MLSGWRSWTDSPRTAARPTRTPWSRCSWSGRRTSPPGLRRRRVPTCRCRSRPTSRPTSRCMTSCPTWRAARRSFGANPFRAWLGQSDAGHDIDRHRPGHRSRGCGPAAGWRPATPMARQARSGPGRSRPPRHRLRARPATAEATSPLERPTKQQTSATEVAWDPSLSGLLRPCGAGMPD